MVVTVRIKNLSSKPVKFVDHPDHYSISVYAAHRSKDEAHNGMFISYARAEKDTVVQVKPNASAVFTSRFKYSRDSKGALRVSDYPFDDEDGYMLIKDNQLRAEFSYGWYPNYLPKEKDGLAGEFVKQALSVDLVFDAPR